MTVVYYYDISGLNMPKCSLPQWATERLAQKRTPRHSAFAYALYCRVYSLLYHLPPPAVTFTCSGAPMSQCHLSFSHSGNFVSLALSEEAVGVDIQRIKPISPLLTERIQSKQYDMSKVRRINCSIKADEVSQDRGQDSESTTDSHLDCALLCFCIAEARAKMLSRGMDYVISRQTDCTPYVTHSVIHDVQRQLYILLCASTQSTIADFVLCNTLFDL